MFFFFFLLASAVRPGVNETLSAWMSSFMAKLERRSTSAEPEAEGSCDAEQHRAGRKKSGSRAMNNYRYSAGNTREDTEESVRRHVRASQAHSSYSCYGVCSENDIGASTIPEHTGNLPPSTDVFDQHIYEVGEVAGKVTSEQGNSKNTPTVTDGHSECVYEDTDGHAECVYEVTGGPAECVYEAADERGCEATDERAGCGYEATDEHAECVSHATGERVNDIYEETGEPAGWVYEPTGNLEEDVYQCIDRSGSYINPLGHTLNTPCVLSALSSTENDIQ